MGESNLAMKEDAFLMTGGKRTLYLCSHCKRDVTQQLRVQCVECSTEKLPFQLCGDCFAVGMNVNLGNGSLHHLNTHNYRVVDCTDAPIFTSDWSASEELLLLEGIEVHGMGNWKTIAEYVNTNKTAAAVETHYWESYMGRHGYCLPAHTLVQGQAVPTLSLLDPEEEDNSISSSKSAAAADDKEKSSKAKSSLARVRLQGGHVLGEEVIRDVGKEALVASLAKEKGPREKLVEQAIRERIASLPGADLPGFMPLREDFDYEYDNNAENLLANMDFDDDDHPSERELKLQIIRIYNKKLDEREARKRFVIDRGIVDFKQQSMVYSFFF